MSATIYDSSLITKLRMSRAQSGDYIRRVQSAQQGFAPYLGMSQQSIINTIQNGNKPYFRKECDSGASIVIPGCPCGDPNNVIVNPQ